MVTAVVTGDNHLGLYQARMRPDQLERRRRRMQAGFETVVDAAIAMNADLFLHLGDLFDRPDPRNADRLFVARQASRLREAGIPMLAIAGNHDCPRSFGYDGGVTPHEEIAALGAVHLFRRTDRFEPVTLEIDGARVSICGLTSNFNLASDACPLESIAETYTRAGDINLLLLHYGIEGWAPPMGSEPCLKRASLERIPADAICVGHLHATRFDRLDSGAVMFNPGATEHISFGEVDLQCGYYVLEWDGRTVAAEHRPITSQPMRTVTVDFTGRTETAPEWADLLMVELARIADPDQLLRVRLTGACPRAVFDELDLAAIRIAGAAANFYFQLDSNDLVAIDPAENWRVDIGFSFDVRQELREAAESFAQAYGDDQTEREVCALAGRAIEAEFNRLTGGAR